MDRVFALVVEVVSGMDIEYLLFLDITRHNALVWAIIAPANLSEVPSIVRDR